MTAEASKKLALLANIPEPKSTKEMVQRALALAADSEVVDEIFSLATLLSADARNPAPRTLEWIAKRALESASVGPVVTIGIAEALWFVSASRDLALACVESASQHDARRSYVHHCAQQLQGLVALERGQVSLAAAHLRSSLDLDDGPHPPALTLGTDLLRSLRERPEAIDACYEYARKCIELIERYGEGRWGDALLFYSVMKSIVEGDA